jgi:hypothetical protein
MTFTPTDDFWSDEFHSYYVKGLTYTVNNEKLAKAVEGWLADGKVVPAVAGARVKGR